MIAPLLAAILLGQSTGNSPQGQTDGAADNAAASAAHALRELVDADDLWRVLLCGGDQPTRDPLRATATSVRRNARMARDLWRATTAPVEIDIKLKRIAALDNELPILEAIGSALEDLLVSAPDADALRGAGRMLSDARPHAPTEWVELADAVSTIVACTRGDLPAARDSLTLLSDAQPRYRLMARLSLAGLAHRTGQSLLAQEITAAIADEQWGEPVPMSDRIFVADVADSRAGPAGASASAQRWLSLLRQSSWEPRRLVRRALPIRIERFASDPSTSFPAEIAEACRAANECDCLDTSDLVELTRCADQDAAAIAAWRLAECVDARSGSPESIAAASTAMEKFARVFPTDPDAEPIARSLVALRQETADAEQLADAFDTLASCAPSPATIEAAKANAAVLRIERILRESPWRSSTTHLRSLADMVPSPRATPDQLALAAAARLRACICDRTTDLCDSISAAAVARQAAAPSVQELLDQAIQLALVLSEACPGQSTATGDWPPGVATALAELALESFCSGTPPAWIARASRTAPDEPQSCAILAQIRRDFSTAESLYRKALILGGESALARAGLAECLIHRGGETALIEAVSLARTAAEYCEVGAPGWWRCNLAELEAIVAAGRNSAQVAAKLARLREAHGLPACPALAARFARLAPP